MNTLIVLAFICGVGIGVIATMVMYEVKSKSY